MNFIGRNVLYEELNFFIIVYKMFLSILYHVFKLYFSMILLTSTKLLNLLT